MEEPTIIEKKRIDGTYRMSIEIIKSKHVYSLPTLKKDKDGNIIGKHVYNSKGDIIGEELFDMEKTTIEEFDDSICNLNYKLGIHHEPNIIIVVSYFHDTKHEKREHGERYSTDGILQCVVYCDDDGVMKSEAPINEEDRQELTNILF